MVVGLSTNFQNRENVENVDVHVENVDAKQNLLWIQLINEFNNFIV